MARQQNKRVLAATGFAPVPFRACVDGELTDFDNRVLAVVAGHDRFSLTSISSNGRGCDAGLERLAHLCNGNRSSVSSSLNKLARFGYLEVGDHPKDGRKKVYRVIYNDDDHAALKVESNPTGGMFALRRTKSAQEVRSMANDTGDLVRPTPMQSDEIVRPNEEMVRADNQLVVDITEEFSPNRENRLRETNRYAEGGIDSAEAGLLNEGEREEDEWADCEPDPDPDHFPVFIHNSDDDVPF